MNSTNKARGVVSMDKLWNFEHPYYMNEGCFHASGCHTEHENFDDFMSEMASADIDLNRIHRWDFNGFKEDDKVKYVTFFYVVQRKGYTYSHCVEVTEADHDRIKEFLKPHAELNAKLWNGIL